MSVQCTTLLLVDKDGYAVRAIHPHLNGDGFRAPAKLRIYSEENIVSYARGAARNFCRITDAMIMSHKSDEATPFKFTLADENELTHTLVFGPTGRGMSVIFPHETFAKSAGFDSWQEAVQKMREGKIVQGVAPCPDKTLLDRQLFNQAVAHAGMVARFNPDFGLVAVGLTSSVID